MKKNYKILIVIIGVLIIVGIGLTYAYFEYFTRIEDNEVYDKLDTVVVSDSTLSLEGIKNNTQGSMYPGHQSLTKFRVTAQGKDTIYYNLVWKGTNTLSTPLKYSVYKTTTSEDPSISCSVKEEGTTAKKYFETCTQNLKNINTAISSGEIPINSSDPIILKDSEVLKSTKDGNVVYYYLVIEYPNLESNQKVNGNYEATIGLEATAIDN